MLSTNTAVQMAVQNIQILRNPDRVDPVSISRITPNWLPPGTSLKKRALPIEIPSD